MRDFTFKKTDLPSMAEFNKRFSGIGGVLNGLGNEHVWEEKCIGAVTDTAKPSSVEVGATNLTGYDVKYSSTAGVVNGVVTLTGDIQRINSPSTLEELSAVLPGKYVQSVRNGTEKAVYYARPDQELFMSGTGVFVRCYAVVSGFVTLGYVNSSDRYAYIEEYHIENGDIDTSYSFVPLLYGGTSGASAQYSANAKIENNSIVLVDPITVTYNQLVALGDSIKGCYYIANSDTSGAAVVSGTLVYIPESASVYVQSGSFGTTQYSIPHIALGAEDGYTYEYMGRLVEKARIATGSYTGTGKHGASTPNSLTFGFAPKFLVVTHSTDPKRFMVAPYGAPKVCTLPDVSGQVLEKITWNRNGVTWYSTMDADIQLNRSGTVYYYTAIG